MNKYFYSYVTTVAGLKNAYEVLKKSRYIALDTETTALIHVDGRMRLLSLGTEVGCFLIDMDYVGPYTVALQKLLSLNAIYIGQNLQFDLKWLWRHGLDLHLPNKPRTCARIFDTMLASQLLSLGRSSVKHGLDSIIENYLEIVISKDEQTSDWSQEELTDSQKTYAATDLQYLFALRLKMIDQLQERNLMEAYKLEVDVLPALAAMTYNGIYIDWEKWESLIPIYLDKVEKARIELLDKYFKPRFDQPTFTGEVEYGVNIDSPKQVLTKLKEFGVKDPLELEKDGLINTTDQKILALLSPIDYPIIGVINEFKRSQRMLSSYLFGWKKLKNAQTGYVYHNLISLGAATSRMASRNPNSQNLTRNTDLRGCICAPPGMVMVSADYSGAEPRITADVYNDANMQLIFSNFDKGIGDDIYVETAKTLLNISDEDWLKLSPAERKEYRQRGKVCVLSLNYAMSAKTFRLRAQVDYGLYLTLEEASNLRDRYFDLYYGVKEKHNDLQKHRNVDTCRSRSGVERIWEEGFPGVPALANYPIQTEQASMMKLALAKLFLILKADGFHPVMDTRIRLSNVVHDECLLFSHPDAAEYARSTLEKCMLEAGTRWMRNVKITTEAHIHTSMADK